jgi:hypothetical protein
MSRRKRNLFLHFEAFFVHSCNSSTMIRWHRNALCFSLFAILSHKLWLRCLQRDDLIAEFRKDG